MTIRFFESMFARGLPICSLLSELSSMISNFPEAILHYCVAAIRTSHARLESNTFDVLVNLPETQARTLEALLLKGKSVPDHHIDAAHMFFTGHAVINLLRIFISLHPFRPLFLISHENSHFVRMAELSASQLSSLTLNALFLGAETKDSLLI